MFHDALTHSGVPDPYPLGISGFGESGPNVRDVRQVAGNVKTMNYARKIWAEVQDEAHVTSADYNLVERLINSGAYGEAVVTIESLRARRPQKSKFQSLTSWIPAGYGFQEQVISGVPNWVLYASAGVATILALRKRR